MKGRLCDCDECAMHSRSTVDPLEGAAKCANAHSLKREVRISTYAVAAPSGEMGLRGNRTVGKSVNPRRVSGNPGKIKMGSVR